MKIPNLPPIRGVCEIFCPHCHGKDYWRHGSYTRSWFHSFYDKGDQVRTVQRFLCLNPSCPRRTFNVQAADVLGYCRFLFTDLLTVAAAMQKKASLHSISRAFGLRRSVVRRVAVFLQRTHDFLISLCHEVTAGDTIAAGFVPLLEVAQSRYCWITLRGLWFRHIYHLML